MYNPIAIIIAGFHGQQDPLWLFFALLSWYLIRRNYPIWLAGLAAGIAFAYKIPTVLLLPVIMWSIGSWKNRALYAGIISVVFLLSLFPEIITSRHALIHQSFLYSSTPGVWGLTDIAEKIFSGIPIVHDIGMQITTTCLKGALALSLIVVYVNAMRQKKFDVFRTIIYVISAFYAFTPGFGTQYLLWILPFLILSENPLLGVYSVLVSILFLHSYGFGFAPLTNLLQFLQDNIYYKTHMLYPYDLYIPVWLLSFVFLFRKEREVRTAIACIGQKLKNQTMKKKVLKQWQRAGKYLEK